MKILLTGSSGQLGKELIQIKPKGFTLIESNRSSIDLTNHSLCHQMIKEIKPDWVINCAAYTNVDKAETEKDLALNINALAPKAFSEALKETGGKLLQISTDFVFDGKRSTPYPTDHKRNPLGIYGLSKCKGEEYIEDILFDSNQAVILRTSWLMGPVGKNFALTILDLHKKRTEVKVISDQIGCPTSTRSLSKACWQIIQLENSKIFSIEKKIPILHWCDNGVASWYDVAVAISDIAKDLNLITKPANIIPIKTESFPLAAKRPCYSLLDCFSTKKLLKNEGNHWRHLLLDTLKSIKNN